MNDGVMPLVAEFYSNHEQIEVILWWIPQDYILSKD